MAGSIIGYIIWVLVNIVFFIIGIVSWKSKVPVGFFSNFKSPENSEIADVRGYNHAVARIWFVFAAIMALLGLPLLAGQNSPLIMISVIGMLWLCIGVCMAYVKVEKKYRTK